MALLLNLEVLGKPVTLDISHARAYRTGIG